MTPSVFRGYSPTGVPYKRQPVLTQEQQLLLVQRARFFLASHDARRALDSATPLPTIDELLTEMRKASSLALPDEMTDTEYRVRESIGRASYNKLFSANQGLVYREVNDLWPSWKEATVVEKADFLQEGAQGLLRALRLFDESKGLSFATYAAWHIRAYVLRTLRDKSRLVRLPQKLQTDMSQIRRARYRFAVENEGCEATTEQLAATLQWTHERVSAALAGLQSEPLSLDATDERVSQQYANDRHSLVERASLRRGEDAAREDGPGRLMSDLEKQQFASTLRRAQCERDPRRARIARLKYGLEDGREWTYPQLAEHFNITAHGARGIVRSELNYLRTKKSKQLASFIE